MKRMIREHREHLNEAQQLAQLGSWHWNLMNGLSHWSDHLFRIFGYPPGALAPGCTAFLQAVVAQDRARIQAALEAALCDSTSFSQECCIVRPDGSMRHVVLMARIERDGHSHLKAMTATVQDITERKNVDDQLQAAKRSAEQANNAKSRFLAAASHDLRQPLAALGLYVRVLQDKVEPGNRHLIDKIKECYGSLSELLNDLLDVSKLDAGVITPRSASFSVDAFFATLVSVHGAEAAQKGLRLRTRPCRFFVGTDWQLLLRIVGNLVANAIRYTREGGVLLACRRHAGKHWLEVWDTGIGIASSQTGLVFEEFIQLAPAHEQRGSGLGLAIVAKLAAVLGLQMRLRSRLGRGSMFAVELPPGEAVGQVLPELLPAPARGQRIALVEDDALLRSALVLALQEEGHQVIAASNAQQLLEQLGEQVPDVVISDYRLGTGQTGFDVIMAVRAAHGSALPALIITGDTDPALVQSMAQSGISIQYKPLKMEVLLVFLSQI